LWECGISDKERDKFYSRRRAKINSIFFSNIQTLFSERKISKIFGKIFPGIERTPILNLAFCCCSIIVRI